MGEWKTASDAPEGVPVRTKIDDAKGIRNHAVLKRMGRDPREQLRLRVKDLRDLFDKLSPTRTDHALRR